MKSLAPLFSAAFVVALLLLAKVSPAQDATKAKEPVAPATLQEAIDACSKNKAGDACGVRVNQRDNHGICVVFTRGDLVCAIDAPP